MSGIAGIWNRDGAPADTALVARMAATLRHRGPDGEEIRTSGSVAFVQQHLFVTPEASARPGLQISPSGAIVVMDGRLDNRDELTARLAISPDMSDASVVLSAYTAWGEGFAERLTGDFAVAVFDEAQQRLLLARDAVGVRPLYYFANETLIAFASEIKALLVHPAIPTVADDDGLADFMLVGCRPVDRQHTTCFAGISAVVPAHICVATRQGVAVRRYWDFDCASPLRLRSHQDYADAFRERFSRAVARRVRTSRPVAISVSGGFDSSSIFCVAETQRRQGVAPFPSLAGISYFGGVGTDADERQYLLDIERAYGVEIERFPIEPFEGIVSGGREQVRGIEAPFMDSMWGVTRELHRKASALGARTLLSGHWGDQVLFSSAYLADLFTRLRWTTIRRHVREYARWFGDREARTLGRRVALDVARTCLPAPLLMPAKWVRRRLTSAARRPSSAFADRFLERALRFANQPVTFDGRFHSAHARSIYLEARSKYHVHCMEWNNKVAALHGMDAAFPFLDRDLLQLLIAIPGDVQNARGVPRALAREAMRAVLPEPVRMRTWKADFSGAVAGGIDRDAHVLHNVLSPAALGVTMGYLDRDRVRAEVTRLTDDSASEGCVDSWAITDLFALEMWLQVFFGEGVSRATDASSASTASQTLGNDESLRGY